MSSLVIFFFIFSTLSILISGFVLPKRVSAPSGKHFGIALILTGLAFALWSYAVVTKSAGSTLYTTVSIGALFFLVALLFYLWSGVSHQTKASQQLLLVSGLVFAIVLWVVRLAYPSNPGFSEQGLFFFNPHPVVKFMYIVLMSAAVLPAISAVAGEMRKNNLASAKVFMSAMTAAVIGGILLLVSTDNTLLYLVGWGLGISYLFLLLSVLGVFRTPNHSRS